MERYICVHGHYYQPPRESPWLEAIQLQDSAYPYHDWNERVSAESYAPNARSRILNNDGQIVQITNNYARTSFNFGPTLLAWMKDAQPDTYEQILGADAESSERFSGHGSALAQVYNHMIMPLANSRDKRTQVAWGMRDFEHRFGRRPEGMWLAETAVDLESLDLLAESGMKFTILAPRQASRVRPLGGRAWRDVSGARIDPTRAYELRLPSGRRIALFFYDGPISQAIAFEDLLQSGEALAQRLTSGFSDGRDWPQLVHIATDGETYGHHHRHGDMALAYALEHIDNGDVARLTNYGEFLEKHPPTHQVEIFEGSSWSCVHGVERWRGDCGCNTGGRSDWNQQWRKPLREALDWLRDEVAPRFEERARQFVREPWAARDGYIDVVLDREPASIAAFEQAHAGRELVGTERIELLKLMELQRHAMLMFTSCGWFFDDLSGIETVQVIQYAGRVIQLARNLFFDDLEPGFLDRLRPARSNVPEQGDGAHIYERSVRPAIVDLTSVGAHYAISSLFAPYSERSRIYCYDVKRDLYESAEAGKMKVAVGRAHVTSVITGEHEDVSFGVVHLGDHNVAGGVRPYGDGSQLATLTEDSIAAFARGDTPEVLRIFDKAFAELSYSLKSLFRDEQRRILRLIMEPILLEASARYREIYENHAPLMRFLTDIGTPLPRRFQAAAEFAIDLNLRNAIDAEMTDVPRALGLLDEARHAGVQLDVAGLNYTLQLAIERLAQRFLEDPAQIALLDGLIAAAELTRVMPGETNLWRTQNIYWQMLQTDYTEFARRAAAGDEDGHAWVDKFRTLGDRLNMHPSALNEA